MKESCALCLESLRCKIELDQLGRKRPQLQNPAFSTPKAKSNLAIQEEEQRQVFVFDPDTFVMDDCGHLFHGACLKVWGQFSSNCPLCEIAGSTDKSDAKLNKSNLGHILTEIQQVLQQGRMTSEDVLFVKSHGRMPGFFDFLFDDKQEKTIQDE